MDGSSSLRDDTGSFHASVAKSGVAFPNGIAFEPKTKTLDVALTIGSEVLSYPMGNDGTRGTASKAWSGTPVDGVARDENQAIYVAHYSNGFVERSTDKAKVGTAKNPKSLAFRGGTLLFAACESSTSSKTGSTSDAKAACEHVNDVCDAYTSDCGRSNDDYNELSDSERGKADEVNECLMDAEDCDGVAKCGQ